MISIFRWLLITFGGLLLLFIIIVVAVLIYGWCYCNLKWCKHCKKFMKRHADGYEDFVGLGRQYCLRFECPECSRWEYKILRINEAEYRHIQKNPLLKNGDLSSMYYGLNAVYEATPPGLKRRNRL